MAVRTKKSTVERRTRALGKMSQRRARKRARSDRTSPGVQKEVALSSIRLPKVAPILPVELKVPKDDTEWASELKFDGFRGMYHLSLEKAWFDSKGRIAMPRFKWLAKYLAEELRQRGVMSAILDGEVVVPDEAGDIRLRHFWEKPNDPVFVAFDLLFLNGTDYRLQPLSARRTMLEALMPERARHIRLSQMVVGRGKETFDLLRRGDFEGIVQKRLSDPYDPEATVWYKVKNPDYSERLAGRRFNQKKRGGA